METQETLSAYAVELTAWAVRAAGTLTQERILRANTRKCIEALRAENLIN